MNFRYAFLLVFITLLLSCDDGDIIITNFDFEDTNLTLCGEGSTRVFYKTNNADVFEAISFAFVNAEFDGVTVGEIVISLNENNKLTYRTFDGTITGSSYFCTEVPPTSPQVIDEFNSTNGGTATLTTRIVPDVTDEDGDGLTNAEENEGANQDTDGDGIPDFQDIDDDGDNVPTTSELGDTPETMLQDTDEDGTPDYLDDDDDNDGTLTRLEDEDMDGNPRNDTSINNILRYLDADANESFVVDVVIENTYSVLFRTRIIFNDLTFDGDGVQAIEGTYDLGLYELSNQDITLQPN